MPTSHPHITAPNGSPQRHHHEPHCKPRDPRERELPARAHQAAAAEQGKGGQPPARGSCGVWGTAETPPLLVAPGPVPPLRAPDSAACTRQLPARCRPDRAPPLPYLRASPLLPPISRPFPFLEIPSSCAASRREPQNPDNWTPPPETRSATPQEDWRGSRARVGHCACAQCGQPSLTLHRLPPLGSDTTRAVGNFRSLARTSFPFFFFLSPPHTHTHPGRLGVRPKSRGAAARQVFVSCASGARARAWKEAGSGWPARRGGGRVAGAGGRRPPWHAHARAGEASCRPPEPGTFLRCARRSAPRLRELTDSPSVGFESCV